MNYPFLYRILDVLDAAELMQNLKLSSTTIDVWDDWILTEIQSPELEKKITGLIPHLKLFRDKIYLSRGTNCNYHIDRFHVHHLLHRILIPLDNHFEYEWIQQEKSVRYRPRPGEVILFNNMVPHRFFIDQGELQKKRDVIYFDMYDPLVEKYLDVMKGDYSFENSLLERKQVKSI